MKSLARKFYKNFTKIFIKNTVIGNFKNYKIKKKEKHHF